MEFTVTTHDIEDAEDLFLLAKDRLLDINEWHHLSANRHSYTLADRNSHKLHRNAHTGDYIISQNNKEEVLHIDSIIYDDFPDMGGESISIHATHMQNEEPFDIIVKRVGKILSVESTEMSFIPDTASFLKNIISTEEYAIAS